MISFYQGYLFYRDASQDVAIGENSECVNVAVLTILILKFDIAFKNNILVLFLCDNLVLLDSGELNILNLYIFPSVRV
jgi:hypothetical protein